MSQTWIILGATSTIARAFARMVSERGDGVLLAGRDMTELELIATDCTHRGASHGEAIAFDSLVQIKLGTGLDSKVTAAEGFAPSAETPTLRAGTALGPAVPPFQYTIPSNFSAPG